MQSPTENLGRFDFPGVKTTRNDGGLRITFSTRGRRIAIAGRIDADGFGPRSLPTDVTPPPLTPDSSYAEIEILSVSALDLAVGQKLVISHGDMELVLEIAASTSVSGLLVSNASTTALADGIAQIVNAYGIDIEASIEPDTPNIVRVSQRTGAGLGRVIVYRKTSSGTEQAISKAAISIKTGSMNPFVGGSAIPFGEPVTPRSRSEAARLLRASRSVGYSNELYTAYDMAVANGDTNVALSRIDYTYRPDENGKYWPVLASTGTLPDEWLVAMGIDPSGELPPDNFLDPLSQYIPSKELRSLPWVGAGDITSTQVHLDPTGADLRYYAIGKAMDVLGDAEPNYVCFARPAGHISPEGALSEPSLGFYPVLRSQLPTNPTVLNAIIAKDIPSANNPYLQGVIYNTNLPEPFPFQSFDVTGVQSAVTVQISDTEDAIGGQVLDGAGITLLVDGIQRTFYYSSVFTPDTNPNQVESTGNPNLVAGRTQLARALANAINRDPILVDSLGRKALATASGDTVTIKSTRGGYSGGVKILPTRLTVIEVDNSAGSALAGDTVILTSSTSFLSTVTLSASATAPFSSTEYDISGTQAEAAASLAAAINANFSDKLVSARAVGANVYLYEFSELTAIAVTMTNTPVTVITDTLTGESQDYWDCTKVDSTVLAPYFLASHIAKSAGVSIENTHVINDGISVSHLGSTYTVLSSGAAGLNHDNRYRYDGSNHPDSTPNLVSALSRTLSESFTSESVAPGRILFRSLVPGSVGNLTATVIGGGTSGTAYNTAFGLQANSANVGYSGSDARAVSRGFAHLAGAFAYSTSIDFMACRASIGLEPQDKDLDGFMSLTELQRVVGKERTHDGANYVDGIPDNGTGLAGFTGMKYLDGTKRLRSNPALPVNYGMWGTSRIDTAGSWSDVHLVTNNTAYGDNVKLDERGNLVDLGAYVDVVAEEGAWNGPSARTWDPESASFITSGDIVYAAVAAALPLGRSTTRQPIPGFRPYRSKTPHMREALSTKGRFVVFEIDPGTTAPRVHDGVTMAYNLDQENRSDYVRWLTCDTVNRVHSGVRYKSYPFLGRTMSADVLNGLRTEIEAHLDELVRSGIIEAYEPALNVSPTDRILSRAELRLALVVPGELRQLITFTDLVPGSEFSA